METLSCEVLEKFMKGEHVMRQQEGYRNGIWSDMFIETTFMRYTKCPRGTFAVTLQPNVVKNYSHYHRDIERSWRYERKSKTNVIRFSQRRSDEDDRAGIRKALDKCINPFQKDLKGLVNIHLRYVANKEVSVHKSIKIGQEQRSKFQTSWPDGFHSPIKNEVRNLSRLDKSRSYSRVTCLLSTARIELEEILKYELSPALLSLFGSNGEMRHSTSKSDLKKKASNRGIWTTSI